MSLRACLHTALIKTQNAFACKIFQHSNALWVQKLSGCIIYTCMSTIYCLHRLLCSVTWHNMVMYGIRQNECNKRATATALESMAACVPLFSHQKCCTLMAAPQYAAFCRENAVCLPNCGAFGKSATIPYPSSSRTNHKSATRFLTKKRFTNLTNCCIFLTHTVHMHQGNLLIYQYIQ